MYPDERVERLINDNFIPARVHVKENAADFQRFGERFNAQWTPTILLIDPGGEVVHRIEGFLLVVGGMVIAMYLPIFDMINAVQ